MSSAAWLAIAIVIATAAIKLMVDEKPHHRHLAGRVLGLVLQRVAILSFRVCRFVDARAVFFGALLHSQLPARDGRLAVRAAHAAAHAAAFAFDMAAAASVRANEWLNVRADALLASFSVVRVVRTGFGAADVRVAGAGDVVLVAARTDAEPTRRGLARAMSPVRGGVARRRLAFDTTAAPPARFYILRRRLDAAADAAGASSTDAVVEWLAEDQRSRQCLLRLFPADGVAYDAELAVRLAAPAVALPLLGRDDASRTLVTPRPSLSLLEYAQRERGSPELPPQVWPLARAIVGRVAELHAAGFAHGSLTWRHIALLPPEATATDDDDDGVGGGDWRLTGLDGCVWCADGGAAGGGGGSSDAPLLATTAELDATAAARAADVEAVGTLALSLLQKGHGGHAADVLIRHAPAATEALSERLARGSPAAAEPAAAAAESARLEAVAAAEEADEAEVRRLIDAVTSGGAASDLALGAVTADQPEALRHLIHDTIVEATLLPPALRTAAADLLPAPIAVRSGGRGLHGAPPPLMPMRANDRMAVRVASAAERGAESLRSLRLASGMRLLLHQAAAAAAPPPGSPRRGAAAAAPPPPPHGDKFVADSSHLLPGAPPSDAAVNPLTTPPPRPPTAAATTPITRFLYDRRGGDDGTPLGVPCDGLKAIRREWSERGAPHERECLEYVLKLRAGDAGGGGGGGGWRRDCGADGQLLSERRRGGGMCEGMCLDDFAAAAEARLAGLEKAHVLALRLYTIPEMARALNAPLCAHARGGCGSAATAAAVPPPPPAGGHPFPATAFYLDQGLRRLQRVATSMRDAPPPELWRGVRSLRLTDGFVAYGCTELGAASCTAQLRAAALAAVGPDALLLKFSERQGGLRAADLRFLSCYPAEAEHVWPPMTHLQPTGNMEVVRLPALGDAKFTVVEVEPRAASARHTM